MMCSGLPESFTGGVRGARALGCPAGLGGDCREMKDGSLERPPELGAARVDSCKDSSSWSKGTGGDGDVGEGEEEGVEEQGGALDEEEEVEGAAARGEGGEAEPAAVEPEALDICLAGRWAAESFLGPWLVEARLRGVVLPGSGPGVAARRLARLWFRCSSWHWVPRGQVPLREKSGHSSVCFFLHLAPSGQ